jgi:hypothetical protein
MARRDFGDAGFNSDESLIFCWATIITFKINISRESARQLNTQKELNKEREQMSTSEIRLSCRLTLTAAQPQDKRTHDWGGK